MHKLLNLFLQVCLLRAGPQDIPAASVVVMLAATGYVGIGVLVAPPGYGPGQALLWSVLDTLLLAALARISLHWRGYPQRFQQTFSALTGSLALITLASWPLMLWLYRLPEKDPGTVLPSLLLSLLVFWSIAVIAHILRNALASKFALGILLALLYMITSWQLSALLFQPAS